MAGVSNSKPGPKFQYLAEVYQKDGVVYCKTSSHDELLDFTDRLDGFICEEHQVKLRVTMKGQLRAEISSATPYNAGTFSLVSLCVRKKGWELVPTRGDEPYYYFEKAVK
jgi:hypothetical protein